MLAAFVAAAQEDVPTGQRAIRNKPLADVYFEEGEFQKALAQYRQLYDQNPRSVVYLDRMVQCYQQLTAYKKAEDLIKLALSKYANYPIIYVLLGYNYQLQKDEKAAKQYYEIAVHKIDANVDYAYTLAEKFTSLSLYNYAIETYLKAIRLKPNYNYEIQLARIYGETNQIEKMFEVYLQLVSKNALAVDGVIHQLDPFISDNPQDTNNATLKKLLLQRSQATGEGVWSEMLSWLFFRQNEYAKAFSQLKALYKRKPTPETEQDLIEMAKLATKSGDTTTAANIYTYITEIPSAVEKLEAELGLVTIALRQKTKSNAEFEQHFKTLFATYPNVSESLDLHILYANFLSEEKHEDDNAIKHLKSLLDQPMTLRQSSIVKLTLADILVKSELFNQALIYYTQVQNSMKNDALAHKAQFKIAQTSFFKCDFRWAETQLKVLKSSTSQLDANDALQLKLLISDNVIEDANQVALKRYAEASLRAFQKKNTQAIAILDDLLTNHKGDKVEDQALFKQAELLEAEGNIERAKQNYKTIIENYPSDILADDALFALARLSEQNPEKAKAYYEKLIFDHPNSIYYHQARKRFRELRGDDTKGI